MKDIVKSKPELPVFGISASEKTRLVLWLELQLETSGHTSIPPKEYAMKEMVQALDNITSGKKRLKFNKTNRKSLRQLGKVEDGIRGFVLRNNWFPLFRPFIVKEIKKDPEIAAFFSNTISISDIYIPALEDNQLTFKVSSTLDCRLLPETDVMDFISCLRRRLDEDRVLVTIKHLIKSHGRTYDPKYYALLSKSIKKEYPEAHNIEIIFPATSDNSIFRGYGAKVFGVFPGVFTQKSLESIHNYNESISKHTFDKAIEVYLSFLEGLKVLESDSSSITYNEN